MSSIWENVTQPDSMGIFFGGCAEAGPYLPCFFTEGRSAIPFHA
jgi:hypothetical protein